MAEFTDASVRLGGRLEVKPRRGRWAAASAGGGARSPAASPAYSRPTGVSFLPVFYISQVSFSAQTAKAAVPFLSGI